MQDWEKERETRLSEVKRMLEHADGLPEEDRLIFLHLLQVLLQLQSEQG